MRPHRRTPSLAQESVAEFYHGKTVRIVVGIGVGSGYDINARLLARHMAHHIPGNPTIIVQNQPGAGSLTMTNQLYAAGPFDGTAIGASFNGMPTTPLLQPQGARFEPTKLIWLGSTNRETQASYVWHTTPVQTPHRRRQHRGDHGRAGAGLDPVRLSGARRTRCSATSSRSSPATRRRRRSISRWSAARCTARSPTGRR